ncbi:hypothetical protein A3F08_00625 [Candidatus Berkelbacteria bacterium RIFCSPHIGHO2_12_FULL_36_9]|uniref:Uncharacterized protein n=1 Tax=Candidatus Berkelbacteria bacterium RIFCSPHIGHO2_12_FULL_36_9 TaxID=1797469 RepID=A0A1F5EEW3_9BACT|nr:MAG: hypothetical protein A3F08_00625 [Candidatus Berkelbacteria bacterium RIFCSPHIGHO2_12_FULL_36_9]
MCYSKTIIEDTIVIASFYGVSSDKEVKNALDKLRHINKCKKCSKEARRMIHRLNNPSKAA